MDGTFKFMDEGFKCSWLRAKAAALGLDWETLSALPEVQALPDWNTSLQVFWMCAVFFYILIRCLSILDVLSLFLCCFLPGGVSLYTQGPDD